MVKKTELNRLVSGAYDCITYLEDDHITMQFIKDDKFLHGAKLYDDYIVIETPGTSSTHHFHRETVYTSMTACKPPGEFSEIEEVAHLVVTLAAKPPDGPKFPSGWEKHICSFSLVCSREFSKCLQGVVNVGLTVTEAAESKG